MKKALARGRRPFVVGIELGCELASSALRLIPGRRRDPAHPG